MSEDSNPYKIKHKVYVFKKDGKPKIILGHKEDVLGLMVLANSYAKKEIKYSDIQKTIEDLGKTTLEGKTNE